MPLFFIVSGAATYFSLKKRKGGQFIKERFLKILIPAIFGTALIIPPITYIARLSPGDFRQLLAHFY
jgi:fucose 4-O-acetylase-like acetyltransferase